MRSCFEEGYLAYYEGVLMNNNPYRGSSWTFHNKIWQEGWRAAMTMDRD